VAARLAELFQHKELEDLFGSLRYTVRESRRLNTGADRRGTKSELAAGAAEFVERTGFPSRLSAPDDR